ncbi:hypothetical protein BLSTO_02298 [Blastocystis sp. subtype 1]
MSRSDNSISTLYPSLHSLSRVHEDLRSLKTRKLTNEEIEHLKQHGNHSSDASWSNVSVMITEEEGELFYIDCFFIGDNVISFQKGEVRFSDDLCLPACVRTTTFKNCVIFPNCFFSNNTLAENCVFLSGSVCMSNGRLTCKPSASFGNGQLCNVGNETGGYSIKLDGDLFYTDMRQLLEEGIQPVFEPIREDRCVIGPSACIEYCSLLDSVFIGEGCHIIASMLVDCTVLGSRANRTLVSNGNATSSILQWGVHFETGSNCVCSLLCEHSFTDCNAKIINSVIAPNTGVSSGECNSSLVGPFIGFHHNSVLISAIWYKGKGNIGYGANIGSNHTGRLPDQELIPGEGLFFGLGCNIKYPCNFMNAPYSLIASGITTLPQVGARRDDDA